MLTGYAHPPRQSNNNHGLLTQQSSGCRIRLLIARDVLVRRARIRTEIFARIRTEIFAHPSSERL
jgi:hypothetical protein